MWYCFVLGLCCLEIRHVGQFLTVFYVSIYIGAVDGFACQQPCLSIPKIHAQLFQHYLGSDAGIILLPFMAIKSIIAICSLNDQYSHRPFCTSALIDERPHNTYSDSMLKSQDLFLLLSCSLVMSMNDSGIIGYVHSQYFFLSIFLMVVSE